VACADPCFDLAFLVREIPVRFRVHAKHPDRPGQKHDRDDSGRCAVGQQTDQTATEDRDHHVDGERRAGAHHDRDAREARAEHQDDEHALVGQFRDEDHQGGGQYVEGVHHPSVGSGPLSFGRRAEL